MLYIMEPNALPYIGFGASHDIIDHRDQVVKGFPTMYQLRTQNSSRI